MEEIIVKFAESEEELMQTYKLRFEELVKEYDEGNDEKIDFQEYDNYSKQLIAIVSGEVIACYRLAYAKDLGDMPFICEKEYNIDCLKNTFKNVLGLSRAVIRKDYRNGKVLIKLWKEVIKYCKDNDVDVLIGTASFYGVDRNEYLNELSLLASEYMLDSKLNVTSKDGLPLMDYISLSDEEKEKAYQNLPPLIKAYIRFGAKFARDSFVDEGFKSVDVFVCFPFKNNDSSFLKRICEE